MTDAVELVINMAFSAASKRGGKDDVVLGTIAALRRIRTAAEEAGATTHRAIAAAPNARGIRTARGGAWMTRQCGICHSGNASNR